FGRHGEAVNAERQLGSNVFSFRGNGKRTLQLVGFTDEERHCGGRTALRVLDFNAEVAALALGRRGKRQGYRGKKRSEEKGQQAPARSGETAQHRDLEGHKTGEYHKSKLTRGGRRRRETNAKLRNYFMKFMKKILRHEPCRECSNRAQCQGLYC